MKRTLEARYRYWESLVKRYWEALRRTEEFRSDCMYRGDARPSEEKIKTRVTRLNEKWGVASTKSDLSYEDFKRHDVPLRSVIAKLQGSETAQEIAPDIPLRMEALYHRIVKLNSIVRSREQDELDEVLEVSTNGRWVELPSDRQYQLLKKQGWCPPQKIHFTVDVDADPFVACEHVMDILTQMRYIRSLSGYSPELSKRTMQKLHARGHGFSNPQDGVRYDFTQDDQFWQVWDLKQQHKTDMEIAQILWPREYKAGKGRNTKTGEKGALAQRVHYCHQEAKQWIKEYPKQVRHSMQVL